MSGGCLRGADVGALELGDAEFGRAPVIVEVLGLDGDQDMDVEGPEGGRTRRTYEGMSVSSRSVKGVGEKIVGFDSAAVAIMTESAPGPY